MANKKPFGGTARVLCIQVMSVFLLIGQNVAAPRQSVAALGNAFKGTALCHPGTLADTALAVSALCLVLLYPHLPL